MKEHKFKLGDRVVYHPVNTGNGCLDGLVGTVIYIDNTHCPYTVEFNDFCDVNTAVTDYRVRDRGAEPMPFHGWFCREENLTLIEM